PVLIAVAFTGPHPVLYCSMLLAAILSDIFDGIIARKLGVATARLRHFDSEADLVFWVCTAVACYVVYPGLVRQHGWQITALLASEALTYLVSFAKFGRSMSSHAFLAKMFGLTLFAGLTSMLCFGVAGFCFYLMLVMGLIANLEIILIILILPHHTHDIPSWYHALQIRRGLPVRKWKLFN
ncbi:MAG: CDP-alcohol phosphatidyltransferase family protein, partial [Deltaproteobacteria bacterium]|nr:CDP-alcohol phosphatidyltransferase family protein [Deltaproteobacteria bacterium]